MSQLPAPTHKQSKERDTLSVSVFRMFTVNATGKGVEHVPKLLLIVIWSGVIAAVLAILATGGLVGAVIKSIW